MIYLMRHGQDDERFIGGWSDVALIPEGIEGVENTADWIKNNLQIKRIIASDILRARQTAGIVGSYLNIPFETSADLREQNKGDLNGMDVNLAKMNYPEYMRGVQIDTVYPNGESLLDLYNRLGNYLKEILSLEDDTLLITHRGVINMIYYILNELPPDMNKERFEVTTASVHELDQKQRLIRKVR